MTIYLYNTLTRQKENFTPADPGRVTMYGCGPTVYNYIHIGNARMIVVFDVLFRLLRHVYGEDHVVYARNITDIDDKIIAAAREQGVPIDTITQKYTEALHADVAGVNALPPTFEPLATQYVPHMIAMIEQLIANGHAYEAEGHVLFHVPSYPAYGALSRRNRDEQVAGARVEVAPYKRDPADFVLWKPSDATQPGWDSPWGVGRPGWHIECSAMSTDLLGKEFDIHGGGLDLTFPHHENEIAQSCCAYKGTQFARIWMHNGFLNVNSEKMSKSLNNFHFLHDLLQDHSGEAIRYTLLSAHYRQPVEFSMDLLKEAKSSLDRWYRVIEKHRAVDATEPTAAFLNALKDDLNTPEAYAELHRLVNEINRTGDETLVGPLKASAAMLGLLQEDPLHWFQGGHPYEDVQINQAIAARAIAKQERNFAEADRIRDELAAMGIILDDTPSGTTWRKA